VIDHGAGDAGAGKAQEAGRFRGLLEGAALGGDDQHDGIRLSRDHPCIASLENRRQVDDDVAPGASHLENLREAGIGEVHRHVRQRLDRADRDERHAADIDDHELIELGGAQKDIDERALAIGEAAGEAGGALAERLARAAPMPGLPAQPAAAAIDVDDDGRIVGLF
jgi:hypothetical protein